MLTIVRHCFVNNNIEMNEIWSLCQGSCSIVKKLDVDINSYNII